MYNRIGVVVLNYNDSETTKAFINNIKDYETIEKIIAVDNCSADDSYNSLSHYFFSSEKVEVIRTDHNGGYGFGNNQGIRWLTNKFQIRYIMICNPDVSFSEETVYRLHSVFEEKKDAAIVAPMMLNADGEKQYITAWKIPTVKEYILFSSKILSRLSSSIFYPESFYENKGAQEVGCVAGSLLMIDTKKLPTDNIYDDKIFLYCEETVLGIKVRELGYKTYIDLDSSFLHLHSVSISKSIPKIISQKKLMWESRTYVLKNYLGCSRMLMAFAFLVRELSLVETRIAMMKNVRVV
jgi:N-acetylglucosaminyl-diphospho-decaprenol L-rhamnosyltransferase